MLIIKLVKLYHNKIKMEEMLLNIHYLIIKIFIIKIVLQIVNIVNILIKIPKYV